MMVRRTCWMLVALLCFVAVLPPASAGPSQIRCEGVTSPRPGWKSIAVAPFENPQLLPPPGVGADRFTVVPGDPNRFFVFNTNEVFQTLDGGCSWNKIFPVDSPDVPFVDCGDSVLERSTFISFVNPCTQVFDVDFSPVGGQGRIYVQVHMFQATGAPPASLVYYSDDAAQTWKRLDIPIPGSSSGTGDLAIAPNAAGTIYVERGGATGVHMILASFDGGATWSARNLPAGYPAQRIDQPLVINPENPKELWTTGEVLRTDSTTRQRYDLVLHSTDGGETWEMIETPIAAHDRTPWISHLDVNHSGSRPARLVVTNSYDVWLSVDGGRSWSAVPGAVRVGPVMFGRGGGHVFVMGDEQEDVVVRYDLKRKLIFMIKEGSFHADGADESGAHYASYVSGQGLTMLGGCQDLVGCSHLYRFRGAGT